MSNSPLSANTYVVLTKGCQALGLHKGQRARVIEVTELGADYSHQVKVVIEITSPRRTARVRWSLYATHRNRLADDEVALLGNVSGQRILLRRGK